MTSVAEVYNHWRYGEQKREYNRRSQGITVRQHSLTSPESVFQTVISTTIPTDPAVIWGCDFAGVYDGTPDMDVFKKRGGRFVYFKAADGTIKAKWIDQNVANAQAQGLVTGAYFWLYKNIRISGSAQAKAWWNIVKGMGLDFECIDFEWTSWNGKPDNPNTGDLWGALDPLQQLTGRLAYIYSASGYLAQYFNHSDQFKKNPFIAAQYGVITPDSVLPWGANGHTIHQITDRWPGGELGVDKYASTAEDGDIFNGDEVKFHIMFPQNTSTPSPNPPMVVATPYPGVQVTDFRRFDTDIQVIQIDRSVISSAIVTAPGVEHRAEEIPGDIVSNGGDFNPTTFHAIGLLHSEGLPFNSQADSEPALGFNDDHTAEISHTKTSWPNAVGLKRYLVVNGVVTSSTSDAWKNKEARKIYSIKADGSLVIIAAKGEQSDQAGLDLFQCAAIAIEFGAWVAGDGDGGKSVQNIVAGKLFEATPARTGVADFVAIEISTGGTSMTTKGTQKSGTYSNVKDISSGAIGAIMHEGDTVYGTLSTQHTDILGFDHFYRSDGSRVELGAQCKVTAQNMTLTTAEDPGGSTVPTSTPATIDHIEVVFKDGSRQTFVLQV